MKLYFYQGLDCGREYDDGFIGVIACDEEQAISIIENDDRFESYLKHGSEFYSSGKPDVFELKDKKYKATIAFYG